MNNTLQDTGIKLGIALIGIKLGIFEKAFLSPISINGYLETSGFDKLYVEKWMLSAHSYGIIKISNDLLSLTTEGRKYSQNSNDSELHNLIQSIFSLLISYESLNHIKEGSRPGYDINYKFNHISEWYTHVNRIKNYAISIELIEKLNNKDIFKKINGSIADYSCGDGWFLEKLKNYLSPSCSLFGIDGHNIVDHSITHLSSEVFFSDPKQYNMIILNKVLHHIWNDDTLIERIIKKMSNDGILLIWEFSWEDEIINKKENRELTFLNYIEHVQNARFLKSKEITERFCGLGMRVKKYYIDNGRQVFFVINN